jgi:hypothetical protein
MEAASFGLCALPHQPIGMMKTLLFSVGERFVTAGYGVWAM